jgi:hypothetical protein
MDVAITHLLRRVTSQGGTKSTAAVHDDFRVRIGKHFFQVALQNPLAQMRGFDGMIFLPFGIFTHVNQNGPRILLESRAGLFNGDFPDARFRIGDKFQKTGRMIHARRLNYAAAGSIEFRFANFS